MEFSLQILPLESINPRADLIAHETATYNFMAELMERAEEREESLLRGVSTEPLVVNLDGLELMDGYTRYIVMQKHHQQQVYVYVGEDSQRQ